jgi:hypothetical protein
LMRKVGQMDSEPGFELNKQQASKVLAIIKTWRTKPTMSNDQANGIMKSVTGLLTPKQVAKLATIQGRRGGMGGPGGDPGGRPGGRPGGGGGMGGPGGGRMGGGMGSPGGRPGEGAGGPGGGRPGAFKLPDPPKGGYNPLNPATLPFEQTRPRATKSLDEFTAKLQARSK